MSKVLSLYQKLTRYPAGHWLFSRAVCLQAPYFGSIHPRFDLLESGRAEAHIRRRRSVQNHIGTIHAIALCNLAELVAGVGIEATLTTDRRWIPKGMQVQYLAKCKHSAHAKARIEIPVDIGTGANCIIPVEIFDRDGTKVARADINMWVTPTRAA
ncbi:MAG: hotdog fold domain-containing protein [Pseudomonadota bacterium]|nr:hotdog fold domain-containing protein [Pseudomonadota bacterium]